jgi:hypothetical protein
VRTEWQKKVEFAESFDYNNLENQENKGDFASCDGNARTCAIEELET